MRCSASFLSVMSRAIFDAPMIVPSVESKGDTVRDNVQQPAGLVSSYGVERLDALTETNPCEDHILFVAMAVRNDGHDRSTDHLLCRIAKHALRSRIPGGDRTVQALTYDGILRRLDDRSQPSCRFRRLLLLGNINVHAAIADRLTLGIPHDFSAPKDPSDFAVLAQNPELGLVGIGPTPDRFDISGEDLLVVVCDAKSPHKRHGNRLIGRLQSQDPKIVRVAPNAVGRDVDIPHTDASCFGKAQLLVTDPDSFAEE